ncbi:MAG: hypothetical protein COA44_09490 [Arcobacter sp.]|nr:MAG: hypothetical protein COA44_09490 [Arcobacter sp.]
MKVIIDLIEDIASAINNDKSFSLSAMCLEEDANAQFHSLWESSLCQYKMDEELKTLYLFLGKEDSINVGSFLEMLNALENKKMMYEIKVSYSKEKKRVDASIIGFSESLEDKKYLLFIS